MTRSCPGAPFVFVKQSVERLDQVDARQLTFQAVGAALLRNASAGTEAQANDSSR
jgi:hypothetical protein